MYRALEDYHYSSAIFYETGIDNLGFIRLISESELNHGVGEPNSQNKAQHQGRKRHC